jgi:hypothetical protein
LGGISRLEAPPEGKKRKRRADHEAIRADNGPDDGYTRDGAPGNHARMEKPDTKNENHEEICKLIY